MVPTAELLKITAKHPFLQGMSEEHLRILVECAMPVEWEQGQLIFKEGDPANRFYLIQKGEIVLDSDVEDRGTVQIETISSGDVLGWSWLFSPYFWHFNARAAKPTKAIFFYGTRLRERCEQDHSLGYELLKRMAAIVIKRLQATRRKLLEAQG